MFWLRCQPLPLVYLSCCCHLLEVLTVSCDVFLTCSWCFGSGPWVVSNVVWFVCAPCRFGAIPWCFSNVPWIVGDVYCSFVIFSEVLVMFSVLTMFFRNLCVWCSLSFCDVPWSFVDVYWSCVIFPETSNFLMFIEVLCFPLKFKQIFLKFWRCPLKVWKPMAQTGPTACKKMQRQRSSALKLNSGSRKWIVISLWNNHNRNMIFNSTAYTMLCLLYEHVQFLLLLVHASDV